MSIDTENRPSVVALTYMQAYLMIEPTVFIPMVQGVVLCH